MRCKEGDSDSSINIVPPGPNTKSTPVFVSRGRDSSVKPTRRLFSVTQQNITNISITTIHGSKYPKAHTEGGDTQTLILEEVSRANSHWDDFDGQLKSLELCLLCVESNTVRMTPTSHSTRH